MNTRLVAIVLAALITACASDPGTPKLDNAQIRDEVVQTSPGEWRLTAFGAEVHSADQVERAFSKRAQSLCAGPMFVPPKAEAYQYDTGTGNATVSHKAFKATGMVRCNR